MPPVFIFYILQSESTGRYYIGQTNNLDARVVRHNSGWTRSGRNRGPWRLVYAEEFSTRSEAVRREREVKRWKSSRLIKRLIDGGY
ncbi:MAG: GIY-YIG nuclease family protein [Candidatus Acidiferrales bacterium]